MSLEIIDLIKKYDQQGPRYTSYPTVPHWTSSFRAEDFQKKISTLSHKTIALYTHIPFCEQKCYFCACNVVITRQKEQADLYLNYLKKEIQLVCSDGSASAMTQIHWGGGTPTYLSSNQMEALFHEYKKYFSIDPKAEISIEIDPRITTFEQLKTLRSLGFNRVSMGVQDFDPKVQASIHRHQTEEQTKRVYEQCKELGFESVNMDFVYGLPFQTLESFEKNVKMIIQLNPDRIAFYNYAHVPWMVSYQKLIPESALPQAELKYELFCSAICLFEEAGYISIGMDHFAKPSDELVIAQKEGTLRRNFMGYTTQKDSNLLAFGVSSISEMGNVYAQNFRKLSDYYKALNENRRPIMRGHILSDDDLLRRYVIMELMCNLKLDVKKVMSSLSSDLTGGSMSFFDYFSKERLTLESMVQEGFVEITQDQIHITSLGKIFIRNICMIFDVYLQKESQRYSRTI